MKLKQSPNGIEVWVDNDIHPYNDIVLGAIEQDNEGYWRFYPAVGAAMSCKHLRTLAEKVSQLNMEIKE